MEKPSTESQPRLETPPARPGEQPMSVEGLRKQREALEQKLAALKQQKEEDIQKQLTEREAIVAELARFSALADEMAETLAYFETQNSKGLLTEQKEVEELGNLRALAVSLHDQRRTALEKYEAIMGNPDVHDRVVEEAEKENVSRELKEKREKASEYFEQKVEELGKEIEDLASRREFARGEVKKKEQDSRAAKKLALSVIDEAIKGLTPEQQKTSLFLRNLETTDDYIAGVERYRKSLGFFKGKEKAAIDHVLQKRHVFEAAAMKANEETEAEHYLETVDDRIDALAERYKALMLEAWDRENQIEGKPPQNFATDSLPYHLYHQIKDALRKRAGLGKEERSRDQKKNEKYERMQKVFVRIEEVAGTHLYWENPEPKG